MRLEILGSQDFRISGFRRLRFRESKSENPDSLSNSGILKS
jgi:hypothetical protein